MIEKVNPAHPDKIADRIAGAVVDMVYRQGISERIAVEVLVGHGVCHVIIETTARLSRDEIADAIARIAGQVVPDIKIYEQDPMLRKNQSGAIRCGDNGIFKGVPLTSEEKYLSSLAKNIYAQYLCDGKYILDGDRLVICQSMADAESLLKICPDAIVNPLGYWTGGTDVDTGATNRKLGSDMAQSVTGGGLHGKDLSKADVSVNIYAFLVAQQENRVVELSCAIGDELIDGIPYREIVDIADAYISGLGGFERFAEWGLF